VENYTTSIYRRENYSEWNAFIGNAKNATFLFHRDFMEYHSERFTDHSLMVYEGKKLVAVLPAHISGGELFSHNGLTYGGLVYGEKMKLASVTLIFRTILKFLRGNKIDKLHIKMLPSIYHLKPSQELDYVLFLVNAKLMRRDALSVLDLSKPYSFSKDRVKCAKRGEKNGLIIKEDTDFRRFWNDILIPNIINRHGVNPVHSLSEIEKLHALFPENIRQFNVYHNDKIVAGTTVFVTDNVAHPQYISGQADKNELGSLDFLYAHLITNVFKVKSFFDFGISNEEQGRKLNQGLAFWKESFGTGTVVQDFYEVETANHSLLDNVLI
jgi:hypothetical protein